VNGPALLSLQLLDNELEQLEQRRKRLPERARLAEAQTAHATHVAERNRLQAIVDAAYATIEQAEHEGAALDTKKARLEAQLKTVIAPREAEALMHEIATIDGHHGELDDRELEAMEQQGEAESAMAELAIAEPALLAAVAAAQSDLDTALAAMSADETRIRERRADADGSLDDADRAAYTAAVKRHGGVGFAQLERHTCTACHVDLSQVEFERVVAQTSGELPDCPHCGRYLVV
jgi:predicted  nucleic acid-binding Zn-ribbon protein